MGLLFTAPRSNNRYLNGGIAIYGGLIAGLIVLLVFCHQRMLPPFLMLDIIAPGVMAAQVIARWG